MLKLDQYAQCFLPGAAGGPLISEDIVGLAKMGERVGPVADTGSTAVTE